MPLNLSFLADSVDESNFLIDFHNEFPPFHDFKVFRKNFEIIVSRLFRPEAIDWWYFVLNLELFFGPVDNTLNKIELLADLFVFNVLHGCLFIVDIDNKAGFFLAEFLEVGSDLFPFLVK